MGVALMMKADVGLGAFDAMNSSLSNITHIKVGTMTTYTNMLIFLLQILILRKEFKKTQFLQVLLIFMLGEIINIFYYQIFRFEVSGYILKIMTFILGSLITSFGVAVLVNLDIVATPAEGLSTAIAKKSKFNFSQIRFALDVIVITFTLVITILFSLPMLLREGTIIGAIVFNISLAKFLKLLSIKNEKNIVENICIDCNSVTSNQI